MEFETSREGDTVDKIAFRRRGATAVVTEQIYKLNRGLAALGVFLPVGTRVRLPERTTARPVRDVKRIWS